MTPSDTRPDFEWVIQARADIQSDLLTLYKMVEGENQPLTAGEYNDPLKISFSLLVGASFSLWRAAFLSHVKQAWPNLATAARKLLYKVLETNTVSFQTDLDCRDWMFGYYLSSALSRLSEAKKTLGVGGPEYADFERVHEHGLFGITDTPHNLWTLLRRTLMALTTELKLRIDASVTSSRGL